MSGKTPQTAIQTAQAKNGDVIIRFATMGEGKPLVLLHGFTDRKESWQEFGYAEPLTRAGHRLILIDQRGHGETSCPHDSKAYTPEARAADAVAVLDALTIERADLLGYSMGGWTALNVARFHPRRIDRLIVGGCHPFGQSMAFYREALTKGIEPWIGIIEAFGGAMSEAFKARVLANDLLALRAAVAADRPDISASLQGFARPCLFYAGSADPLHKEVARSADFLPRARFFEVPGCNHMTALLRADLIVPELLAFLAKENAEQG